MYTPTTYHRTKDANIVTAPYAWDWHTLDCGVRLAIGPTSAKWRHGFDQIRLLCLQITLLRLRNIMELHLLLIPSRSPSSPECSWPWFRYSIVFVVPVMIIKRHKTNTLTFDCSKLLLYSPQDTAEICTVTY